MLAASTATPVVNVLFTRSTEAHSRSSAPSLNTGTWKLLLVIVKLAVTGNDKLLVATTSLSAKIMYGAVTIPLRSTTALSINNGSTTVNAPAKETLAPLSTKVSTDTSPFNGVNAALLSPPAKYRLVKPVLRLLR